MRRRDFIKGIAGSTIAWPLAARAAPVGKQVKIGFLYPGPEAVAQSRSALLLEGLRSEGIDPQSVTLIVRGTDGDTARIGPLLDELIAAEPDLLIPVGPPVARAAHAIVKTIPMVTFDMETDPIEAGWLQGYAHPGGNMSGVFLDFPDFSTKWLELLKEAVPKLANIVVLWDPTTAMVQTKAVADAARLVNVNSEVLEVRLCRIGAQISPAGDFDLLEFRQSWRPDVLRTEACRCLSRNRHHGGQGSQRHQARRSSSRAAKSLRACCQYADRESDEPDNFARDAVARRRGDRMRQRMSTCGAKQT